MENILQKEAVLDCVVVPRGVTVPFIKCVCSVARLSAVFGSVRVVKEIHGNIFLTSTDKIPALTGKIRSVYVSSVFLNSAVIQVM